MMDLQTALVYVHREATIEDLRKRQAMEKDRYWSKACWEIMYGVACQYLEE